MKRQNILFVDGYNMIGAWPDLVQLKKENKLEEARYMLYQELLQYAKYSHYYIDLVFDAHHTLDPQTIIPKPSRYDMLDTKRPWVRVIYTDKDETADTYIETHVKKAMNRLTQITVATSDLSEQWVVFSQGALRISARELYELIHQSKKEWHQEIQQHHIKEYQRNSPWNAQQLTELTHYLHQLEQD